MSANFTAGFLVGKPAWHRLGTLLAQAPADVREAIKLAGLDWEVHASIPQTDDGKSLQGFAQVFRRSDNQEVLGVVGPRTTPLQNSESFAFFQPFLDAGEAKLETAGCLDGGKKVWILAKLNRQNSEILPGDEVAKYLLLSNSHDGSLSVRLGYSPVRVVCQNTLSAAHANGASKLIRIRHTASVKQNVEAVRDCMDLANEAFEATADQFRLLARRGINPRDVRKYVKRVMDLDRPNEELSTKGRNIIDVVLQKYEVEKGICQQLLDEARERDEQERDAHARIGAAVMDAVLEGVETDTARANGTWWAAYNGVTRYLTHDAGRNDSSRLSSLWFGANEATNRRALQLATDLAEA